MPTLPRVLTTTAATGLILGRVLDADTRAPIAGAALWVRSPTGASPVDIVRTNATGDFVIRHLPGGRWFIAVSKAGFLQKTLTGEDVVLSEGARVVDLVLFLTRNAAITGAVTDECGEPLAGVQVALLERSPRKTWHGAGFATTDDRGVYRFSSLSAGDYVVAASSTAIDSAPIEAARVIRLSSGREVGGVDVRLVGSGTKRPRGAAITGRVTDEHGDPLAVTVQVLTRSADSGYLIVVPAARPVQAHTDERGVYRVHGLPRGVYYIGVTHGMVGAGTAGHETTPADLRWARAVIDGTAAPAAASQDGAPVGQGPMTVYGPTFHPSALTPADATPITVGQDEERTGVDVVVRLVPSVSLRGSVIAPDGSVPDSIVVSLTPNRPYVPAGSILGAAASGTAWSLGGLVTPPVTSGGRFRILSLTPGTYTLVAQGAVRTLDEAAGDGEPTRMWARATVTLGKEAVTDIVITLEPRISADGRRDDRGTLPIEPRLAAAGGAGR
jgi:hypothetical protein